ncbi:MAG: DNA-binding protein [Hyphomicrobiales bacterium]|nr:ImmA/IrrE family metallo-endopeptidase [Hyphomicrobiales bacterium]PCJ92781.1 MAG: DNA-binding protein [Hyphomicrobiales bacterium]
MSNIGNMLRLARQRKGFTQKFASGKLGVTQPVLSRYENGAAEADSSFLLLASRVYDIPKGFFSLNEPVYGPAVSVHPMPRAKASVTARDLDMVTAELNIRAMQMRRFLDGVDYSPTSNLPQFDVESYGTPTKIAALLRAHWKLPFGPINNLTALVERAGIIVAHSDFGGASVSGMTFQVPGQPPLILLNGAHPADRMRLTLGHELGHVIMHKFPTPDMEREAFEFSSTFLFPPNELRSQFRGRKPTLELLASLKPEWKMAMSAILYAANREKLITPNQYRYLNMQIAKRGWKTREPSNLDFAHETPKIMTAILRAHLDELGYTFDDLLNFIPMYKTEFTTLYGDVGKPVNNKPKLRIVN